ncbi:hypothetical protein KM799_15245 [Clostridium tyrobutyricum]|uniref:hypothetical protein n=1 Tax=Clostridium tyrobutyricum TaxID=1519 RepID=UPI001C380FC8|nr:hypothetical protein [Clostridium tyrobutyricum]MBV4441445.1 hypothetical protein [Clostridium tyrobutyricum]MBV4447945.1 hypothetical protein [Clostridium tyrobutyricum]
MKSIWDIVSNIVVVSAILLNILISMKWFRKSQDKNRRIYKVLRTMQVVSIVFICIYTVSNLQYYVGQIVQGGKTHTFLKTLFFTIE